jgi:hypothetical protein
MVIEDKDYANIKYKIIIPQNRVAGETGPELSSDEE